MNMKELGRRLLWPNYSRPNSPPFVWMDCVKPRNYQQKRRSGRDLDRDNLTKKKAAVANFKVKRFRHFMSTRVGIAHCINQRCVR